MAAVAASAANVAPMANFNVNLSAMKSAAAMTGSNGSANGVASKMNDNLASQLSAIQAAAAAGDVDAQALLKELGPLMKQSFGEDEESLIY